MIKPDFISFFRDLQKNNYREWFQENKKRYETHVKKPFYGLVQELINRVREEEPDMDLEVKNAVFRINRDIRFSKDKSPYKTHVGAVISPGGRKDMNIPGMYLHLEVGNTMIGGGAYKPTKENLQKIREAIAREPEKFMKLLNDKKFVRYFPQGIEGDRNKVLPKEFKEVAEKYPILYQKDYFFMARYPESEVLVRDDFPDFFMEHYHAAKPVNEFLRNAIGM